MILGNIVVAHYLDVVNQSLRTFFDVERDLDLGLVVDSLRCNLDVFKTAIVIQSFQVGDTLLQQLLTDTTMGPEVGLLHHDLGQQVFVGNLVISSEEDAIDFVLLAFVDLIDQQYLVGLSLKVYFYLYVEVALLLKVID